MSIDDVARSTALRTAGSVTATTDTAAALRDLRQIRSRRIGVRLTALAVVVVTLIGVWWGTAGVPFRRSSPPVSPHPTPTVTSNKAFLAAPPLCGPHEVTVPFGYDAAVDPGPCPTGPGRYLSLNVGLNTEGAFAFTLPAGWTVKAIPSGGPGATSVAGGLQLSSTRTGATIALTVYPNPPGPQDGQLHGSILTPSGYVQEASNNPAVLATRLHDVRLGGRNAAGADFTLRPGAAHRDHCLIGDGCATVFTVWSVPTPGLGAFGVFPDRPSRLIAFIQPGPRLPVIAWMWGPRGAASVEADAELVSIVDSISLANDAGLTPP